MVTSNRIFLVVGLVAGFLVSFLWQWNSTKVVGKNAHFSLRRPASSPGSEFSSQIDQKFKAMKSPADVKAVIALTDKLAKENPQDKTLKVYKGLMMAMSASEGLTYRLYGDNNSLSFGELMGVSLVRKVQSNLYRVGPHFNPFFDYVFGKTAKPRIAKWKKFSDFQNYYLNTVRPDINGAIKILQEAAGKTSDEDLNKTVFTFDLAVLLGDDRAQSLINPANRYLEVTTEHLHWIIADLYRFQGLMTYLASYDFNGYSKLMGKNTKKSAFKNIVDSVFKSHFSRAPIKRDFYKELHKSKYKNLFTMRDVKLEGKYLLTMSRDYFYASTLHRMRAVKGLEVQKDFGKGTKYIVSANYLLGMSMANKTSLSKRQEMVGKNGVFVFNDPIFSKSFEVNLSEMFNPNNPITRDLKQLMPRPQDYKSKRTTKDSYPTFLYADRPDSLPDYSMGGVFPKSRSMDDLENILEILSHDNALPLLGFWLDLFV